MAKKYYITTTLPYVNAEPHIGFAMEIVQADTIARLKTLSGFDVFFNFGTDEHGVKIYRKALDAGKDPKVYSDEYAEKFDNLKKALNLSYNNFIRTTDEHHLKAAQKFWELSLANGDIYKKNYKIKYCVGCELEKTDSELVDGRCPLHPNSELELIEEENYFFKFSKYQKPLLDFYDKNPEFVVPNFRYHEIKNFVTQGITDFSISRLKNKMPWGIEVPNDPEHIMYVWFDALINYISALGWPENEEKFHDFWPGTQVAGKDNLRQQSAIWQAMLMSAGIPNSKQIFIHGFITSNGQKISKSLGNVVDPYDLVNKYGTDATRYFLLSKMNPFEDSDFTYEKFEEAYNSDLANGLGNLVSRVAKLAENKKYEIKSMENENKIFPEVSLLVEQFQFEKALQLIWEKIKILDKYINDEKPWEKSDAEAAKILTNIIVGNQDFVSIKDIAYTLQIFIPETALNIQKIFAGPTIKSTPALFPRLSVK